MKLPRLAARRVCGLEFGVRGKKLLILLFLLLLPTTYYLPRTIHAENDRCNHVADLTDLNEIQSCAADLNNSLQLSLKATKPLESQLNVLKGQLAALQAKLQQLTAGILQKEKDLQIREDKLVVQQALLNSRVRSYYIRSFLASPLIVILSSGGSGDLFRELSYRQAATKEDQRVIAQVTADMLDLLAQKEKLETDKASVSSLQAQVDANAQALGKVVKEAKAYQADLSGKIAALTARQEEILAQRLASLHISRSASSLGRCDSDLTNGRDPGFSPKFAAFTYGVPNRVGLNQWGAYGRAQAGQRYDQILKAYYNFDGYQNFDNGIRINVDGFGGYNLEDYVKRIYEVPGDWPLEVLKAQAIAARSYVLAYTGGGSGSICATESCQVFKPDPKGGAWEQAVNDTAGKVMVQSGRPIKAWFSSTHGGYVFSSSSIGWSGTSWTKNVMDTTGSVGSFSDLAGSSYDRDSPWFYCDWGSRSQYNKTAWLKPEELADIANVLLLAQKDSGTGDHLYQPDKPNPAGTDTWDPDRVKSELRSRGGSPLNSVSSVSVSADFGSGRATSVNVSGDGLSASFSASDFKTYFNLRAPASIQIVGPLFNVEKR